MDVSVFNYLISTTDSDNPFGAVSAPSTAPKNDISTGEAFLNVLNQVRNGKTEKSSEAVFSTLTSRAETSANAKKIGTSDNASQNVRVIKVHLKRTRSSSTLAKAEAKPAEQPQAGQKIPTMETAQKTEQPQTAVQSPVQADTVKQSDFEQKTVEQITEKTDVLPTDATAADILLFAALPVEKPVETPKSESFAPVEAEQTAPVEQSAPEQTDALPEAAPAQVKPTQKQGETASVQTKQAPVQTVEKPQDFTPVQTTETPISAPAVKRETAQPVLEQKTEIRPEQTDAAPVKTADIAVKPQTEKTEIKAVKAETKQTQIQPQQAETAETADAPEAAPEHFERAAKQAEKLARNLPAETKVAITVETQTAQPAAVLKAATAPVEHKESRAPVKAEAKTEQSESFAPLTAETAQTEPAAPATQPNPRTVQPQQQEQQQQIQPKADAFQPLFAPVQTAAQTVESAEISASAPASVSAVSNAAASPAVFTAPNELKGKAVSAPVVAQKQTPVNDLVDQIKVKITKAFKDGTNKIEIVLRPKELGTIRVRLETGKDGKTTVHLTASRAETIDMLQRDVSALKQALDNAGLNTGDQAFTFNYRGEEQQNSSPEQKTASFLHNEAQAESETQDSPAESSNHALNIRV